MVRPRLFLRLGALTMAVVVSHGAMADSTLLNVSYDPTRELYQDYNRGLRQILEGQDRRDGDDQPVPRRLGRSGPLGDRRARGRRRHAGLWPTTSTPSPEAGLIAAGLADRLPQQQHALHLDHRVPGAQGQSQAYQGLGRSGQAGRRGDHAQSQDLGRARWNYLAAWGYALTPTTATRPRRPRSSTALFKNVPVLDSGARGATLTFVQRGIGDVLLAWENEAMLAVNELGQGRVRDRRPLAFDPGRAAGRRGR